MSKRRAAAKRGAATKAIQREIAKRLAAEKQPSFGAVRAAKLIDENAPLFCDNKCPNHEAHHATFQKRLAELIDRETGCKEMLAALERIIEVSKTIPAIRGGSLTGAECRALDQAQYAVNKAKGGQ